MDLTQLLSALQTAQTTGKAAKPKPIKASKAAPTLPDNVQLPEDPEQSLVFLGILALALEQVADTDSEYNSPVVIDFKLADALSTAELTEPIRTITTRLELGGFIRRFFKADKRGRNHAFYVPVCLSQEQATVKGARGDRGARSSSFLRSLKDLETRLATNADRAEKTGTEG